MMADTGPFFLGAGVVVDPNKQRHVSLFYISKYDLRAACDLTDLLERYVSPLFGVTIAGNVSFTLNTWGIPFYNRVQDFVVDGVQFDDLPEQLLVGTNGYIAPTFWKTAELSYGAMGSIPLDADGNRIAASDVESTFATGLPIESELFIRFLEKQEQKQL